MRKGLRSNNPAGVDAAATRETVTPMLTACNLPPRKVLISIRPRVDSTLSSFPPPRDSRSMEKGVLASTDEAKQHPEAETPLEVIWTRTCHYETCGSDAALWSAIPVRISLRGEKCAYQTLRGCAADLASAIAYAKQTSNVNITAEGGYVA